MGIIIFNTKMAATKIPEMWKLRMATDDVYTDYVKNAHDSWNPIPDNVAQFGVGYGLYYNFVHFYMMEWVAVIVILILQFIWQMKNGLVPYVNVKTTNGVPVSTSNRYLGGFGYSFEAEIYGAMGLIVALLIDLMWPPHIERKYDNNE